MDIARDLLDKQIVDRNGREMGRADGIVAEVRDGEPPRVSAILIGASALGERLHPVAGRWARAVERALGIASERPVRIELADVARFTADVRIDRAIGETSAGIVERMLREWIGRIPGAR